jgi:nitrate/TMAO reductase-like tetraheme cytochrome c subunit
MPGFLKNTIRKIFVFIRPKIVSFAAGIVAAIIVFVLINTAAKPFSKSDYCGSTCHEMTEAYKSWELSAHYANDNGVVAECVDCHLPPKEKFFTHMIAKAYAGGKDYWVHHFGGEYDEQKMREEVLGSMPNERCLSCHKGLLVKPSTAAAGFAHEQARVNDKNLGTRYVKCHENLHNRDETIYRP